MSVQAEHNSCRCKRNITQLLCSFVVPELLKYALVLVLVLILLVVLVLVLVLVLLLLLVVVVVVVVAAVAAHLIFVLLRTLKIVKQVVFSYFLTLSEQKAP